MSLLEKLAELKEAAPDNVINLDEPEREEAVEPEEHDEPEAEEAEEADEPGDVEQEDDEKPEVKGYRRRRVKDVEKERDEERQRAQRLEQQLADMNKALLERIPQQQEKPTPKANAEPDPNTDPDGWVKWKLEQPGQQVKELGEVVQQLKFEQAYTAASNELGRREAAYAKTDPDYFDAIEHGTQREIAKAKLLDPNANESQIRANLERERVQVAAHFAKLGKDPVASIKELMVQSYGYTPKASGKSEADNFDTVRKNKAKSATGLSAGGRNGNDNAVSNDSARRMSVGDFAKLSRAEKDRIFQNKAR